MCHARTHVFEPPFSVLSHHYMSLSYYMSLYVPRITSGLGSIVWHAYPCIKHVTFALMYLNRHLSVLSHGYMSLSHYKALYSLSNCSLSMVRLLYQKLSVCMKHVTFTLMYLSCHHLNALSHCYMSLSHYMSLYVLSHCCLSIVRLLYQKLYVCINMLHSHSCT